MPELRPEVDHAPPYHGWRFSLRVSYTTTRPVPEHRSHAIHVPRSMSCTRLEASRKQVRSSYEPAVVAATISCHKLVDVVVEAVDYGVDVG